MYILYIALASLQILGYVNEVSIELLYDVTNNRLLYRLQRESSIQTVLSEYKLFYLKIYH